MGLMDRLAGEPRYDDHPDHDVSWERTPLEQDPDDPNHWTYTSPAPPVLRVKLERGMKGTYGWEISAEGTQPLLVQQQIEGLDCWLRAHFGTTDG